MLKPRICLLSVVIGFGCLFGGACGAGGCSITLPTDMPDLEPVVLVSSDGVSPLKLFEPTGEVTMIPVGAKLLLLCAGNKNMINEISQQSLELECTKDKVFKTASDEEYKLNQLGCKSIPSSTLRLTSERCSKNQGYVFEAGFAFGKNDFEKTFIICYDNVTETAFYARNIINGAAINYNIKQSTRRAFSAEGMKFTTTATNKLYTINNQIARFESYFGSKQTYVDKSMFLARGHLAPDSDFIFSYEQLSTYYYANAAPEFQVINAGNWIRVENMARKLASNYGSDLLVFTSTLGILQLPKANNTLQSIYLDSDNAIKAPKWYYKVLMHPQLATSVVMITLNNPHASATDVEEFCTNVCTKFALSSPNFSNLASGYTFCCTLADFQKSVSNLPKFDLPSGW